jgi:hypothetical protein
MRRAEYTDPETSFPLRPGDISMTRMKPTIQELRRLLSPAASSTAPPFQGHRKSHAFTDMPQWRGLHPIVAKEPVMKRHKISKLQLSRETLHSLGDANLAAAAGGLAITNPGNPMPVSLNCSNVISVCISCTTPIDGCPPVYTTPAYTCA